LFRPLLLLDRRAPGPILLSDPVRPRVTEAVEVVPGGGAVARRGTRHRGDTGRPVPVQDARGGHLDRRAPDAVRLADHERLRAVGEVTVEPPGGAVTPRGTPPRGRPGSPAPGQEAPAG